MLRAEAGDRGEARVSTTSDARVTAGPLPDPTLWRDQLSETRDAGELRRSLTARYAALAPGRIRELAILGAAEEGKRLAGLCVGRGIRVRAIVDDNPVRQGRMIGGQAVVATAALTELPHHVPVVIASHRVLKAADQLRAAGFATVAPFGMLQVLDPAAFPPHMFYDGLIEDLLANRAAYLQLADMLADDMSRRVLDAILAFRLSFDPSVLRPIVEWDLYGPRDLLHYGDDEVYVDGGAYDGDSIRLFIERVRGRYSRVLAFEPDRSTFKRLVANFADEKRVEPINAGLHRQKEVLRFDNAGTRGSLLVEEGGIEIPVVGLDEILDGDRVTLIKMNIEGAEQDALAGAGRAIQRWAPKLAISVYHRPSDLWQIPRIVRELRSDYDLYLRQHDGGIIETVLYAIARRG
jgi:FkbM family methyltransferase